MSLNAVKANKSRVGTCPHGLPLGACPICNGMSGGGAKKTDNSTKAGEMTWEQCAAIGAFLKAQRLAKMQRKQDAINFAQKALAFEKAMMNASQKLANLGGFFAQKTPAIISKPVNFILNNVVGKMLNVLAKMPVTIAKVFQVVQQKLADISDKLTAMMGELKTAVEKKISEAFKNLKKKIKSIFAIFKPLDAENEEKQVDETKKTFELKTFIHDLLNKITQKEENND
jgi:hypothetical protein